jgi:hypothetical protein
MMRGIRRLVVVYGAVAGLLTAGAVTASMEVAHADTALTGCFAVASSKVPYECTMQGTINNPASITVSVTDHAGADNVTVNWAVECAGGNDTAGAPAARPTPATVDLTLPAPASGVCQVQATVDIAPPYSTTAYANCIKPGATPTATATPTGSPSPTPPTCPTGFTAQITYTTSSPAVHPIKGFGGKCVDDKGNSSANRAAIVIWSCSGSDQAENWKFSGGEFIHNGKCMNDKGDGGTGSKIILYACNGGSNEKWSKLANGELKLQAHGGTLCLDDPRSSTTNGTQLIVYTCKDSANQKWSLS